MAKSESSIRSVSRTFEILEVIRDLDGATIGEITERVDIGQRSVYNYLKTLEHNEYVDKDGDEYHIGLPLFSLGSHARNLVPIYDIAQPQVDRLAEETGELATLFVENNGLGVYLYYASGTNGIELGTHEGEPVHLHSTASGKALLAFRSQCEVDGIVSEHGLPMLTSNTITTRESLDNELTAIRERGYAESDEEQRPGLRSLAAPITDDDGRSIASIGLSCPVHRVDDDQFYGDYLTALQGAANVIELEYNYA
ncbi:IclR family transcriptional regulator [Halopiger xanaduensis]|uniref:Transcriptional regulator, IclR family n=1 Tax=Halopiger xanaduensis (strain DSM 18323 / JCM 14033 / SH-6) TaxID=797210 RepID=F8DE12_HALXS|nr:IclR family transcriptional regulator [Halopiger xanaduensis]AEH39115.1 transcriptional regulator, IclR family [Halopiger xanaduensis SH-6]